MSKITPKCHFCTECKGTGCISELPGTGGIRKNINFQLNCSDWDIYPRNDVSDEELYKLNPPTIRLAPITGGSENVGYAVEEEFYYDIIEACCRANIALSIGDGCPDVKLKSGIAAVEKNKAKAAVFIKPYANKKIIERAEWASGIAEIIGIDIDAYNILTMRNLVSLEKKNAGLLSEIKQYVNGVLKVPFALKGIFTTQDIELVKAVKPDIVAISNHGGRVDNRTGSTIDFLAEQHKTLEQYCGEIWIDGGIRKKRDIFVASYFGAKQVMIARPLISALCKDGINGVKDYIEKTYK
ncbi:MAG: alpha-hydroxy-acid oxidizing protein [Spirochaetaceae bacterium]|nr:alpha-hydroxy-acid oxidizing protein [Spirochaetaceae bacterium]